MAFLDYVGVLGGLANSALNAVTGMAQSKSLMRYQAQLQQKQIDAANQYNSPVNQMIRLRDAGLNPNLVYGSGAVTGNQSDAGKVSAVNRDAGINLNTDSVAQLRLQRQMTEQNIKESQWRTMQRMVDAASGMLKNKFTRATFADSVNQVKQNVNHTIQSINESQQRTNNLVVDANRLAELAKQEEIRTALLKNYGAEEVKAKIAELKARAGLHGANAKIADSVIKLNDAKIHQLEEDAKWLASRTHGQDLENQLTERMNNLGLQGLTPKDFFVFLKDLALSFVRGK